jgi:hypothetical protein
MVVSKTRRLKISKKAISKPKNKGGKTLGKGKKTLKGKKGGGIMISKQRKEDETNLVKILESLKKEYEDTIFEVESYLKEDKKEEGEKLLEKEKKAYQKQIESLNKRIEEIDRVLIYYLEDIKKQLPEESTVGGAFLGIGRDEEVKEKAKKTLGDWYKEELGKTIWVEDDYFKELSPAEQEERLQKWTEINDELKNASLEKLKAIKEDARKSLQKLVDIGKDQNIELKPKEFRKYHDPWGKEVKKFIDYTIGVPLSLKAKTKEWYLKELGKTIWVPDELFDELSPKEQEAYDKKWDDLNKKLKEGYSQELEDIKKAAEDSRKKLIEIHEEYKKAEIEFSQKDEWMKDINNLIDNIESARQKFRRTITFNDHSGDEMPVPLAPGENLPDSYHDINLAEAPPFPASAPTTPSPVPAQVHKDPSPSDGEPPFAFGY